MVGVLPPLVIRIVHVLHPVILLAEKLDHVLTEILDTTGECFVDHRIRPRLVHGDIHGRIDRRRIARPVVLGAYLDASLGEGDEGMLECRGEGFASCGQDGDIAHSGSCESIITDDLRDTNRSRPGRSPHPTPRYLMRRLPGAASILQTIAESSDPAMCRRGASS